MPLSCHQLLFSLHTDTTSSESCVMPCSRAEGKSQQILTGWNLSNQTGHLWDVLAWPLHISWCFTEVNCQALIVYLSQQKLVLVHVFLYSPCQLVCMCVQVCMYACVCKCACMHVCMCVCVCVPCLVASQAHQGTCVEDVRVISL